MGSLEAVLRETLLCPSNSSGASVSGEVTKSACWGGNLHPRSPSSRMARDVNVNRQHQELDSTYSGFFPERGERGRVTLGYKEGGICWRPGNY